MGVATHTKVVHTKIAYVGVATNSTHTKVVHTKIVYVGVATNSTRVPHEVLAEAASEG